MVSQADQAVNQERNHGLQLVKNHTEMPALRRTLRADHLDVRPLRSRAALAGRPLCHLRPAAAHSRPAMRALPATTTRVRSGRRALALRVSHRQPDHPFQTPGALAAGPSAGRATGPPSRARVQRRAAATGCVAAGAAGDTAIAPARLQPGADAGGLAGRRASADGGRFAAAAGHRNPGTAATGRRDPAAQPARRLRPGGRARRGGPAFRPGRRRAYHRRYCRSPGTAAQTRRRDAGGCLLPGAHAEAWGMSCELQAPSQTKPSVNGRMNLRAANSTPLPLGRSRGCPAQR